MSQFERNMDVLNRHRLIYIRQPIDDIPTEVYDWGNYYDYGTHQHYALFRSRAKITTYKSLKWHLLVLWYLNPQLDQDGFDMVAKQIVTKENGFVTFTVSDQLLKSIIYEVSMCDLENAPVNMPEELNPSWLASQALIKALNDYIDWYGCRDSKMDKILPIEHQEGAVVTAMTLLKKLLNQQL